MVFDTRHFSSVSEQYDARSSLSKSLIMKDYLNKRTKHITDCKIIDLGVGTGGFSNIFSSCNELIGVDKNQNMLEIAKKTGVKVICADLRCLPFIEHTFDVALCRQVLQYFSFSEASDLLRESFRVLSPNGSLFLHHMVPIDREHGIVLKEFMRIEGNSHPYLLHQEIITYAIKAGFRVINEGVDKFVAHETVNSFMDYRKIGISEFKQRCELINNYGINDIIINGSSLSYSNYYSFLELRK